MELSEEFKKRFVRSLQGKDFILYGGVLQLARANGLKRITTKIVQIPTEENGMQAIVEAEVETSDGIFSEVGDANPSNVTRTIQPHILRMAATRAKARAMRDAVGIDMVALEELGDVNGEDVEHDFDLIEERFSSMPSQDLVIRFGKYVNHSLGEIMNVDKGYVEWLSRNARDEVVRNAAKDIIEQEYDDMANLDMSKN